MVIILKLILLCRTELRLTCLQKTVYRSCAPEHGECVDICDVSVHTTACCVVCVQGGELVVIQSALYTIQAYKTLFQKELSVFLQSVV